jgi:fucose permease
VARRAEIAIVYLAGLAQGFALVVVPAAAALLTSPQGYAFTDTEYGALFVPLVIGAVAASVTGGVLAARWGLRRLFLAGLLLDVVAMGLVALSAAFLGQPGPAYGTLLVAMFLLGLGFGSTLTAVNSLAPGFFPDHAESALTALHTLLGSGTALAPALVGAASGRDWWWMPALVATLLLVLAGAGLTQPLRIAVAPPASPRRLPGRLWAFLGVAALYGICETLYGNWAILYLHGERGVPARAASFALTAFWAMLSLGRLLIAVAAVWLPPRWVYRALPGLLVISFLAVSRAATPASGIVLFGLAGLACSAFLPLSVGLAQRQVPRLADLMAGAAMAAYMGGYGIASFAVGPMVHAGWTGLGGMYAWASLVAATMVVMAFRLTRT